MKLKLLLLWVLMILTQNVFSQHKLTEMLSYARANKQSPDSVKMNSEFLLLGTLNDYISRKYVNNEGQFDRYDPYEKLLKKYIDSVVKKAFNISLIDKGDHYVSEEMTRRMDAFYQGDRLKDGILYSSAENKLSFLTGVYLRYGEKINNNLYKIWLRNSAKHLNCYEILKQLGCTHIYYKHLNNIPASDFLYFEATPIIKKYFATVAVYQEKILNEQLAYHFKNSADPKEAYHKIFERENDKVQSLFEEP
ncbi:hypothetical protein [Pedobacter sp. UBA5917]|jgi:hypothetical protein|uniref:hypothetical protein n=1 Tax=Pedobacter sp. UBA5917 TaxID=1947061 RepID=UPI0025EDD957|nr:hypothetical protein [Pedobacter sp. UBA5917]